MKGFESLLKMKTKTLHELFAEYQPPVRKTFQPGTVIIPLQECPYTLAFDKPGEGRVPRPCFVARVLRKPFPVYTERVMSNSRIGEVVDIIVGTWATSEKGTSTDVYWLGSSSHFRQATTLEEADASVFVKELVVSAKEYFDNPFTPGTEIVHRREEFAQTKLPVFGDSAIVVPEGEFPVLDLVDMALYADRGDQAANNWNMDVIRALVRSPDATSLVFSFNPLHFKRK